MATAPATKRARSEKPPKDDKSDDTKEPVATEMTYTFLSYQVLQNCGVHCLMGRTKHTLSSDPVTYCRHAFNGLGLDQYTPPSSKQAAAFHCRGRPIDLCAFDRVRTIGVCVECQGCIAVSSLSDESKTPLPVNLQTLFPKETFTPEQIARENHFFLCQFCRGKLLCPIVGESQARSHLLNKLQLTASEFKKPTITASYVCEQIVKLILAELRGAKKDGTDALLTDLLKKTFAAWSQLIQKLSYSSLERLLEACLAKSKVESASAAAPPTPANITSFHVMLSWNHFLLSFK